MMACISVCVCVCVCVCARLCVCVCSPMHKRKREREREDILNIEKELLTNKDISLHAAPNFDQRKSQFPITQLPISINANPNFVSYGVHVSYSETISKRQISLNTSK